MNDGSFQKVGKSAERMFGPPCILVCGYEDQEQEKIMALFKSCDLGEHPVVFATENDKGMTLKDLVGAGSGKGAGQSSGLRRAIIMSGFSEEELHRLLSAYRTGGFPAQLWATLTQVSEGWSLEQLLDALADEAEAFKKRQREQQNAPN